jgi:hypothetical protein
MPTRLALAALLALLAAAPVSAAARDDAGRLPWFGLRLGGVTAASTPAGGSSGAGGLGGSALFDARDFLADASADLFVADRVHVVAAGLGAYYPFLPGNVAPYAGGGVKVGWTRFGGEGTFGMIPYAAAGLLVGRGYYPQLRVELTYFVATSRERAAAEVGSGVRAHGVSATFGLAF